MAGTNIDRDQILAIEPVDHVAGPDTAAVTVLTYCDFECPYCRRASLVIKRLRGPLQDRLRYVFRHLPLTAKHPFAQQAAEIAEAAGTQGKFWPMHDFLFDNQETLEIEDLYEYAAMIGLDATRLQNEVADRVYAARVARDRDSGMQLGVTGTPTFFVNRQRHTDEDTLEQALRRAA
jgi:protein-disulfide isomerase